MRSKSILNWSIAAAIFSCVILLIALCAKEEKFPELDSEGRESILDRRISIEPQLITEIPFVERWCERLDLKNHHINVGDANLYVEEEGKGMPLVLINGGPGGTHHYFHPWFSKAKKYARVIYYDQRGCGLSDFKPGKEGYSVQQAVEDLDALRNALEIDKWVVLGYSYGGFLAQYYTVNHPEYVAGLILLGASPGMQADTGESRQGQYMSAEEKARLTEIRKELMLMSKQKKLPRKKLVQLLIYNNFLNGDWKRQNFYKPSKQRLSEIALYEWDQDMNFNGIMNRSQDNVNLTGAFEGNPIPTLILEGKYDLTWGEEKPELLLKNHPNAKMVMFESAAHGIYDEEPEKFFSVLKNFVENLADVSGDEISAYKTAQRTREKRQESPPDKILASFGWGLNSSQKLAEEYSRDWLEQVGTLSGYMRTGFALYDVGDCEEALSVFKGMQRVAAKQNEKAYEAESLIWQGHMLDLLGQRDKAVHRYTRAAEMNLNETWMHSQYDLKYSLSPYARERVKEPFQRIENRDID